MQVSDESEYYVLKDEKTVLEVSSNGLIRWDIWDGPVKVFGANLDAFNKRKIGREEAIEKIKYYQSTVSRQY